MPPIPSASFASAAKRRRSPLSHPHIAAIHDLLESSGSQFLVLELVDGETLAERIQRGRVPPAEAVTIARQIAEALEAAHAPGIVHRDLKPANVKITPGGAVKVLDFGLAKATLDESDAASLTQSPTMVASPTRAGVILGTAAYMSPEQARGQRVDAQSDIWALGCVLFEMLAGQQAFGGATVTDVLAAVARAEPDWSQLPRETPARMRTLLRRCLQKDRARRLHHVADVRIELEELASGDAEATGSSSPERSRNARGAWLAAAVLLVATAALARSGVGIGW